MTLEQIDQRLTLWLVWFKQYQTPSEVMRLFKETGILWIGYNRSFEQWLFDNGYEELI